MTTIKERVLKIPEYKGVKKELFFKELGLSYANFKGIQKKSALSSDAIDKIITNNPDINIEWLVMGKGSMLNESSAIASEEEQSYITYDKNKGRPFYNVEFGLGFSEDTEVGSLNPEFNISFPPANKNSISWYAAKGNSMLGEIDSGDYIALEQIEDFSWFPMGKIYGIVTKNGIRTVKRIIKSENKENYLLVSSNPDKLKHPDEEIPKNMIFQLFKVAHVIKDLEY